MNKIFENNFEKKENRHDLKVYAPSAGEKYMRPPIERTSRRIAYLTFDDGPSEVTPYLLDALKENNVNATFFISFMGEDTPVKRAVLKREAEDGYAIGVHSWSHDYFFVYSNEEYFLYDFKKMQYIIQEVTGIDPKICRFPGGTGNTVSIIASHGRIIMPALVGAVESMGFKPFDWNAGGEDALIPYPTSEQLVQSILMDAKGQDNLVILLHDTHLFSIDAVPELVRILRANGYAFEMLTPESKTVLQPFAR